MTNKNPKFNRKSLIAPTQTENCKKLWSVQMYSDHFFDSITRDQFAVFIILTERNETAT